MGLGRGRLVARRDSLARNVSVPLGVVGAMVLQCVHSTRNGPVTSLRRNPRNRSRVRGFQRRRTAFLVGTSFAPNVTRSGTTRRMYAKVCSRIDCAHVESAHPP